MDIFSIDFPLSRPHCGVPLGNGRMGVLVWGGESRLCLTINRSEYWEHRQGECVLPGQSYKDLIEIYENPDPLSDPDERFVHKTMPINHAKDGIRWVPTRLPVGRFELILKSRFRLHKAILEYDSGVLVINAGDAELRISQSLKSHILLIEDPENIIGGIKCRPAWEWVGKTLAKVGFEAPEILNGENRYGWRQSCPKDPGITALCRKTSFGYSVTLDLDGEPAAAAEPEAVKSETATWWGKYWAEVPEISIPDVFLNKFYKLTMYKFACATYPEGAACSLQGPWHEEYQMAQWSGDYHFNVNIQQIYTLAFSTGRFEHLMPLFNMLESEPFQNIMRNNAKNLFGIDDGLLMTHAVDDRGMQCGGVGAGAVLDFACGGWTAQLYWLYYKYTHDRDFLENRAYPFICGIMRVFEESLEEYNGKLSIPLSISAEYGVEFKIKRHDRNWDRRTGRDPSYQLACTHMLTDILLECSKILGIEPRPVCLDIKKRLPKYTLVGSKGEERIAIWEGQDLDVCHRHHSHLACIYPFDSLGEWGDEDKRIIENSIDHWIAIGMGEWSEWCYPWAAIIQARMGFREAPAVLLGIWKELFVNEGWATVYLPKFRGLTALRREDMLKPKDTSEIMQLDGTMGGATAILEMLVHQKGDTVYVFPAVPIQWKNISFKNVCLPGAFRISAKRRNSQIETISVKSLKGGQLRIRFDGHPAKIIDFNPGEEKLVL
jgi:alpha-L-fucosidase 2